jgi:hypothetical protein
MCRHRRFTGVHERTQECLDLAVAACQRAISIPLPEATLPQEVPRGRPPPARATLALLISAALLAACESATEPPALDGLEHVIRFSSGGDPNESCAEWIAYQQDSHVTFGANTSFNVPQCGNLLPALLSGPVDWRVHYKLGTEDPSTHHYWARRIRFADDGSTQDWHNFLTYDTLPHAWVDVTVSASLNVLHDGVIWALYPRLGPGFTFGPDGYGQPEIFGHVWMYKEPPENVVAVGDTGSVTVRWSNLHAGRTIDSTYVSRFHIDEGVHTVFSFAWNDSVFVDAGLAGGYYQYQVWHQETPLTSYWAWAATSRMRSENVQTPTVMVGLTPPHSLLCEPYETDGVACSWTHAGSWDVEVYRQDTPLSAWTYVDLVPGGTTYGYYADTGLDQGQVYSYRVRHVSGSFTSPWSATSSAAAGVVLAAPHSLHCGSYGLDGVVCNWTNGGSWDVEVYRQDTPLSAWTYVDLVPGGTTYGYYVDTGLNPWQVYRYRMRHVSGSYISLWSNTSGATAGGYDPAGGDPW